MTLGDVRLLEVLLAPTLQETVRVGTIYRDEVGNTVFTVDDSYIDLGEARPILGAAWYWPGDEAKSAAALRTRRDKTGRFGLLAPWFQNVLPEGALRDAIERQMGVGRVHTDFDIMCRVGTDLPGAVVVREHGMATEPPSPVAPDDLPPIRFGLAGVQMKLSMFKQGEGLTVPAEGQLGSVIAKLPSRDRALASLPELEYSAMRLAQAAGVNAATCELVGIDKIEGIGKEHLKYGSHILAVTRFDREGNRRVHVEDFAQVVGVVGNQKYTMATEEAVLNVIRRISSEPMEDLLEGVRRLVVNILLGNGDAHLKNTSFIYRDPRRPRLSPAYDIVPTFCLDNDDTFALEFAGIRQMTSVRLERFDRPSQLLEVEPRVVRRQVAATVERAADTWPSLLPELPLLKKHASVLRRRWETVALTEGRRGIYQTDVKMAASSVLTPPYPKDTHQAILSRDKRTVTIYRIDEKGHRRIDNPLGPAIISDDGKTYALNGERLTEEDWARRCQNRSQEP